MSGAPASVTPASPPPPLPPDTRLPISQPPSFSDPGRLTSSNNVTTDDSPPFCRTRQRPPPRLARRRTQARFRRSGRCTGSASSRTSSGAPSTFSASCESAKRAASCRTRFDARTAIGAPISPSPGHLRRLIIRRPLRTARSPVARPPARSHHRSPAVPYPSSFTSLIRPVDRDTRRPVQSSRPRVGAMSGSGGEVRVADGRGC